MALSIAVIATTITIPVVIGPWSITDRGSFLSSVPPFVEEFGPAIVVLLTRFELCRRILLGHPRFAHQNYWWKNAKAGVRKTGPTQQSLITNQFSFLNAGERLLRNEND
jgi:hypothetical protein